MPEGGGFLSREGQPQGHPPALAGGRAAGAGAWAVGAGVRLAGHLRPRGPPTGGAWGRPCWALGLSAHCRPGVSLGGRPGPRAPGTGSSHWPHWAQPPLAAGCEPGRRGWQLPHSSRRPRASREHKSRPGQVQQLLWVRTAQQAVVYLYDRVYLFIGLLLGGAQTRTRNSRPGRRGGWVLSP